MRVFSLPCRELFFRILHQVVMLKKFFLHLLLDPYCSIMVFQTGRQKDQPG
jgi:hypothetical protein